MSQVIAIGQTGTFVVINQRLDVDFIRTQNIARFFRCVSTYVGGAVTQAGFEMAGPTLSWTIGKRSRHLTRFSSRKLQDDDHCGDELCSISSIHHFHQCHGKHEGTKETWHSRIICLGVIFISLDSDFLYLYM